VGKGDRLLGLHPVAPFAGGGLRIAESPRQTVLDTGV
jgi:hypothetical protein